VAGKVTRIMKPCRVLSGARARTAKPGGSASLRNGPLQFQGLGAACQHLEDLSISFVSASVLGTITRLRALQDLETAHALTGGGDTLPQGRPQSEISVFVRGAMTIDECSSPRGHDAGVGGG
jgi:hypothetical protein